MTRKLFVQAIGKFVLGVAIVALLLFVPAGTLWFWNAWLLMGVLFVPMLGAGIVLMIRNPTLLQRRLNVKEQQREQKAVVAWSGTMFLAAFVIAGLTFRFGWVRFPAPVVMLATVVFLAAYGMYAEVLRENTYLSRTVEVQEHQKVIDTGLYGIIRHPMYAATLLMFLSMGIILGSPVSFFILLSYLPIIAVRIRSEEKILEKMAAAIPSALDGGLRLPKA